MKTVLITGATRSIGLETAKQLVKKGLFVYLGSRNIEKGNIIIEELKNDGTEGIKAIQLDVTDPASILAARNFIEKDNGKLDILINNAGISGKLPQNASNTPLGDIREAFETNFFGTINVTQTFLPLLRNSESPRITNVTSGLSSLTLHNDPKWIFYAFKGASYGPSKTALNAYTIALAYELKDTKFKVNAIDPGFTATDFNQHRGNGTVEEAAKFIIEHTLLEDEHATGQFYSKDIAEDNKVSPW